MRLQIIIVLLLYTLFTPTESCLPSWFRQERSAEPLEGKLIDRKIEETNEIGEIDEPPSTTIQTAYVDEMDTTSTSAEMTTTTEQNLNELKEETEEAGKMLADADTEYQYEYVDEKQIDEEVEEAIEGLKYNEDATKQASATFTPEVSREIEKLKEAKCEDYCHHNATCHVEVIFHDSKVSAVVPSCHCPHGWEGTRCERHYVPAFYAPVSRYNQSSSTIPVFAILIVSLLVFVTIVVCAYKRISKRADETTYTMSHMCPPEAFTVLKTPNGRKITVNHHEPIFEKTPTDIRMPMRVAAMKSIDPNSKNNFFSILRSQGTIPSRNINEDDTPKHYKSVPRVEVSAINYSGHIDFSTISYPCGAADESCSRPHRTSPPPTHVAIEMEEIRTPTRTRSRADGEPSTPTSSEPMVFVA